MAFCDLCEVVSLGRGWRCRVGEFLSLGWRRKFSRTNGRPLGWTEGREGGERGEREEREGGIMS